MDGVQCLVKVAEVVSWKASLDWEVFPKEDVNVNHSESYFISNEVSCLRSLSDFCFIQASSKLEFNARQSILLNCG